MLNTAIQPPATPPETPAAPNRPGGRQSASREQLRSVLSTLAILLVAPLVAVLLTFFVFQSYQVNGQSMEPALHHNDRLLIWKLPRTLARITGHAYVPHRGDIVVLSEENLSQFGNAGQQIIKRVIGLPGERVVIKDNTVTVYNNANPQGFNPDKTMSYGKGLEGVVTAGQVDVTVPAASVFVLGDNRPHSLDSRSPQLGPISVNDIVGKLTARVMPFDKIDRF